MDCELSNAPVLEKKGGSVPFIKQISLLERFEQKYIPEPRLWMLAMDGGRKSPRLRHDRHRQQKRRKHENHSLTV